MAEIDLNILDRRLALNREETALSLNVPAATIDNLYRPRQLPGRLTEEHRRFDRRDVTVFLEGLREQTA